MPKHKSPRPVLPVWSGSLVHDGDGRVFAGIFELPHAPPGLRIDSLLPFELPFLPHATAPGCCTALAARSSRKC